jgi:hypothetical protein
MLFWPLRATDWKRPNLLIFAPFNPGRAYFSHFGPRIGMVQKVSAIF